MTKKILEFANLELTKIGNEELISQKVLSFNHPHGQPSRWLVSFFILSDFPSGNNLFKSYQEEWIIRALERFVGLIAPLLTLIDIIVLLMLIPPLSITIKAIS